MIIKSWKFKGFNNDMPQWVQEETSKRPGSPDLWVHTQRGEEPAQVGQWISVNLRGHVDIHNEKPEGWMKEILTGVAFTVLVLTVLVVMLAM
jgi:hypothetical protein